MLKNLFERYQKLSFKEIHIAPDHKKQLKNELFKKSIKKPFWTWTKAIFTAPALAVLMIAFFFYSNQGTVNQILKPQEALAQALENTFNPQTFNKTFGFPDDKLFHHRTIESKYINDPNASNLEYQIQKIDLWSDGLQTRKDYRIDLDHFQMFNSMMSNAEGDLCLTIKMTPPECVSLEKQQKESLDQLTSPDNFYNISQEQWLKKLNVFKFEDPNGLPKLEISWSTAAPINGIMIKYGNSLSLLDRGISLIQKENSSYFKDGFNYYNQPKGGQNLHSIVINDIDPSLSNELYFQIQNPDLTFEAPWLQNPNEAHEKGVKQVSMVYKFNLVTQDLKKLLPEEITAEIKNHSQSQEILDDTLEIALQPAFYVMKNPKEFQNPNNIQTVEIKDKKAISLNYNVPDKYFFQFGMGNFPEASSYTIDLFMNEDGNKFLGYEIKGDGKELNSIWLEDEILSESEKEKVFDKSKWLDLAQKEYEKMKPFNR